jgi:transglutaminase-like putative cysteine protease
MSGRWSGLTRSVSTSLLTAAFAWSALLAWSGLLEQPRRFLGPALIGAVVIAVLGGVLRARHLPWPAVTLAQTVVVLLWLQTRTSARHGIEAVLPTWSGIERMVTTVHAGAVQVNRFSSPIAATHHDAVQYFLALGTLVVLGVDLIAQGLRRPPWAALPVLVALAVPVAVLDQDLHGLVFGACALLFVTMLAVDENDRVGRWARTGGSLGTHALTGPRSGDPARVRGTAAGLGLFATFGALLIPAIAPVGDGLIHGGHGVGHGGGTESILLVNPVVDLHRDLVQGGNLPLVRATTTDSDLDYLQIAVLDTFDGTRWLPSRRDLTSDHRADGRIPLPAGLDPSTPTAPVIWNMAITSAFQTSWLPVPSPVSAVVTSVGDWRYDVRTLDFVRVDQQPQATVPYVAEALHPQIDATALAAAAPAPAALRSQMTALPPNMPEVVARTARRVTAGATSDYDRMVKLQEWFRSNGGFTYSLTVDPGSSTDALTRFITTDRVGFCEQFAGAMAVMARSLGIPARVVVGMLSPKSDVAGQAVYTTDSLHAWPEIYFQGAGWVRFEPTPAVRTGTPPSYTLPQPKTLPSATPTAKPGVRKPVTSSHRPQLPDVAQLQSGGSGVTDALLWTALPLALILIAVPGVWRSRLRRRRLGVREGTPSDRAAESLWTEILATATDLGIAWPRTRSIRVVAEVFARTAMPEPADLSRLRALVAWVEEARFDRPRTVAAEELATYTADARRWCEVLAGASPRGVRLVARALPRSILKRTASAVSTDRTLVRH